MSTPTNSAVSTDVQGMLIAENLMGEIYGDLKAAIAKLGEQQGELAANWSGEASSVFGQALNNMLEDFQTINNALVGMLQAMGANRSIYTNTNESSTAMAQAFTKGTGGMLTVQSLGGAIQSTTGLSGF